MNNNYNEWLNTPAEEKSFSKPTAEEYAKAKENYKLYSSWIRKCRERKNELLDQLLREHESEKLYISELEKYQDMIRLYEIYEELEK